MRLNTIESMVIVALLLSLGFGLFADSWALSVNTDSSAGVVQIQSLRSESMEEHVFLDSQESVFFSAFDELDGLNFESINVEMNSPNQTFLRELETDLYIASYEYFGNLGAWTSNQNFTITNPNSMEQELFLKITRNYLQTSYAIDSIIDNVHTIEFTSGPAADRVFVRWNMFASLKSVEVNQSIVDVSSLNRSLFPIMVEFLPTYASFHLPVPQRIQGTHFLLKLEERDFEPPTGYCYVSAILLEQRVVTLGPQQEFLFDIPDLRGWTYLTTAAYTNLTISQYPEPYPFQLVNLAVWEPDTDPLLATAVDAPFGVRNLSNQTYTLGFDIVYYYWQNQTSLEFTHEVIGSDENYIFHEVSANVTDADAGADVGLVGQYLRFHMPGGTVIFDAPDPVGKYEQSYIPLRQGFYRLVTREDRIEADVTSELDDFGLSNTLSFQVKHKGYPFGDAEIEVEQSGIFTSRTYRVYTNANGEANVTIRSIGPEMNQLTIRVSKDDFNYTEKTVNYFVGVLWLFAVVGVAVIIVTLLVIYRRRKVLRF